MPEVGQRDPAARLLVGDALQRRARRDRRRGGRGGGPAGRARSGWSPAAAARSWPSSPTQEGLVDLIIPRGGEGLKKALSAVAKVPVIYAASGNCHVYVDASADLERAVEIVLNAKTQRPGVCNAAETLLVHADAADAFLPGALRALAERRRRAARRRADPRARARRGRGRGGDRGGLRDGVPRARPRGAGRGLGGGGDRARRGLRLRALRGDPHRLDGGGAGVPARRRRGGASTSTPRPGSPTAASSGWAPRSATRRRSCTRAARSACASCARSSTSSRATGTRVA